MTITLGPDNLLIHNAQHHLLICRQCEFAIQKSALESHLLRHKIYRSDRQNLLSAINQLELLEPDDVPSPDQGSSPIEGLPILNGYSCTLPECGHLTISEKRMRRHWNEAHGEMAVKGYWKRDARMQTFFRGTKVRYFEVGQGVSVVNVNRGAESCDPSKQSDNSSRELIAETTIIPQAHPSTNPAAASEAASELSTMNADLEAMTYFHHFITKTVLKLPGMRGSQSATDYWQKHVIPLALQQYWLMCGLLALSADHLAATIGDVARREKHRECADTYHWKFSNMRARIWWGNSRSDTSNTEETTIRKQIQELLKCPTWSVAEIAADLELTDPDNLKLALKTIHGCIRIDRSECDNNIHRDPRDSDGFLIPGRPASQTEQSQASNQQTETSLGSNTPPAILTRLRALPLRIAEALGPPNNPDDASATVEAITALVRCCDTSFASRDVVLVWQDLVRWLDMWLETYLDPNARSHFGQMPTAQDHFSQMLADSHPAALVVVAHWAAILLRRAQTVGCWYLKGVPNGIVMLITEQLSASGSAALPLVEGLARTVML